MSSTTATTINLATLSSTFAAFLTCAKHEGGEWMDRHESAINDMLEALPSGSGIDAGMKFDWQASTPQRLVFTFSFHHMDPNGYYDGWTDHSLVITPTFGDYDMRITGRDRNDVKEYLYQMFGDIFTVKD